LKDIQEAARTVGQQIHVLQASSEGELDTAFAALPGLRAGALLVCSDPYFNSRRDQIIALAARHAIPAIYEWRDFATAGGLMSYGTSITDTYRQVGVYTGRALKGEKPLTCQSFGRPGSSWSLISRPRKSLASRCQTPCNCSPTR
jgi:putative ABC transport system substrate-binding protein